MLDDLVICAIALHGQHPAVHPQQGQAPLDQLVQRRHRAGRHDIQFASLSAYRGVLRSASDDHHIDIEFADHFPEEVRAAQQRFNQHDVCLGPGQRQRDARQAGTTSDIADPFAIEDQLTYSGAIHHVTVPQPSDFRRPDQSTFDTGARQDGRVPFRLPNLISEYSDGGRRRGWCFTLFHVKHPPRRHAAVELQLCN